MADAGFRLTVEGEKDFKKALGEINAQIKANKAEIKALTEEYKLNDAGIGTLQNKQETLERTMEQQKEKVRLLADEFEAASGTYGDTDSAVLKLKEDMNKAREELAKTTQDWEENTRTMKEMEEATQGTAQAEEEWRRSMEEIADSLRVNESELKLLNAQYGDGEEAARGLAEKNRVLTDSMGKQLEKIEKLKKALDEAEGEYGQQSKEVADYKVQLNEAQTELAEITQQIKANNEALEETGKTKLDGLSEGLDDILDKVGIDIPDGIKDIIGGFDDASLAAGGIAAAVTGAVGKMKELHKETMKWADELTTSAQQMGLTTEEYQALEYAATALGVPMDVLVDAFKEINNKAGEADAVLGPYVAGLKSLKDASEEEIKQLNEASAAWDEYGVQLYDQQGKLKTTRQLFDELIERFHEMPAGVNRSKEMMDMFGESAYRLNPIVEAGTNAMRRYEQEAYDTGVVLEKELVAAMDASALAADKWSKKIESATKRVGAAFQKVFSLQGLLDLLEGNPFADIINNSIELMGGIPSYATGTMNHPGGLALVGEEGPEIVNLPAGSQVIPNTGVQMMGGSVHQTVNVYVDHIESMKEIERIAASQRTNIRMGYTKE